MNRTLSLLTLAFFAFVTVFAPTRPARAQHDSSSAYSVNFDSGAGGANAFDGTHTLAALGIDDSSPGGPHASISGGALVITRQGTEFVTTPVLKVGSGVPFGASYIEFTGASVSAPASQLYVLGDWQPNAGGAGVSRSYCAYVQNGGLYLGLTYNTSAAQNGQPVLVFGGPTTYAWVSTDKYRLWLILSAGLGQSTDLCGLLQDLTTGAVTLARHDGDRSMPPGGGSWGVASFFCAPATITRWWIGANFGDNLGTYPAVNTKVDVEDGDSLMYGSGSSTVGAASPQGKNGPSVLSRLLGPTWTVLNAGKPGLNSANLALQNGANIAAIPAGMTDSVYSLRIGTNDLSYEAAAGTGTPDLGYAPSAVFARIKTLLGYARAAGYAHLIIHTVPYSVQPAGNGNTQAQNTALFKGYADTLNGLIRTGLVGAANGSWADAVCDDAALPHLQDPTSTVYFVGDGRHFTDLGYADLGAAGYNAVAQVDPAGVAQPFFLTAGDEAALTAINTGVTTISANTTAAAQQANMTASLTAQGWTAALIAQQQASIQQILAYSARSYAGEWGPQTKSGGVYSVAMPTLSLTIPAPGAVVGTVTPAYDGLGHPANTGKTVN